MNRVDIFRNRLIDFNKGIYFDSDQKSWIVTDDTLIENIVKSPHFSSNRLAKKLENSNISEETRQQLLNFYDTWIMYKDGEDHAKTRDKASSLIRMLNKNVTKLNINQIIEEKVYTIVNDEAESLNLVDEIQNLCHEIMSRLFGVSAKTYRQIFEISTPITLLMYENIITEEQAVSAIAAMQNLSNFLDELVVTNQIEEDSVLQRMILDNHVPIGLISNILIDGEDPLESLLKSITFKWANGMLSDFQTSVVHILRYWAPFTSLSRICTSETVISSQNIKIGDRVLCIIAKSNQRKVHGDETRLMSFGIGSHKCMGEGLAMRLSKILHTQLVKTEMPFILKRYKTNKTFGYFTFTEILVERKVMQ